MKNKILVIDPLDENTLLRLKVKYDLVEKINPTPDELSSLISESEILIMRSGVKITKEILDQASNLQIIARAGNGVDNIDLEEAKRKGIIVFRVPSQSSLSVAELGFGLLLSLSRKIVLSDSQLRAGLWKKFELYGHELSGKTVGIIGLGSIGSILAKISHGFSMKILGTVANPTAQRKKDLYKQNIQLSSLDDLLKKSDVVFLTVPLNINTTNLIFKDKIDMMKKNSLLINLARSQVINERDLLSALKEKKIGGVALDVHSQEQGRSPFINFDTVVLTPHIGAMTFDVQLRIGKLVEKNIENALLGKDVENRVV